MELTEDLEIWWSDYRRSLQRRGRSLATIGVYRGAFESFWRWAITEGIDDPTKVDTATVNRWTDYMLTAPATRNGRPVVAKDPATGEMVEKVIEPATRRIRWVNCRPFFTWYAKEVRQSNPFDGADPPGEGHPEPTPVLELDDVKRLLATCGTLEFADLRDAAIIRMLFDTGARLGELLALKVDDFDRRNDLLTLRGKTGARVVPASPSTGEALARYLRQGRTTHPKAHLEAMWLGPKGALTKSGISQLLRRRCEAAGIEHVNPHRFRHNWAHAFRVAGGSEGDLMYLAGWKSTAMAHRYGRSAAAERAQQAARRFNLGDTL